MKLIKCTLLAILPLILLIGCQTTNIRQDYSLDSTSGNNIALVVGSVTQNLESSKHTVSSFKIDYQSKSTTKTMYSQITNEFLGTLANKYEFKENDRGGRLFVVEIESGRHSVDNFSINHNGGQLVLHPKVPPPSLEFDIKQGEIMYLGSFHIDIKSGKNLLGFAVPVGGVPSIGDMYDRDVKYFYEKYPQFNDENVINNTLHEGVWIDDINKPEALVIPTSDEQ